MENQKMIYLAVFWLGCFGGIAVMSLMAIASDD